MIKSIFLFALLIICSFLSYGQIWTGRVFFEAPKNKIEKPVFYIKEIKDNTGNGPILGRALTKEKIPFTLYYKGSIEDSLLNISNKIIKPKGKLTPLIAKIDSLTIYPHTTKKNVDVHVCYAEIEFFKREPDNFISYGIIKSEERIYGASDFRNTITNILRKCYAELNEKIKEEEIDKIEMSDPFENIKLYESGFIKNKFKGGIYYTFQQLKNQTPVDTLDVKYEELDTSGIYILTGIDKTGLNKTFAFVDSTELFIKLGLLKSKGSQIGFIKSHFNGRFCYFEGDVSKFEKQSGSDYTVAFRDVGNSMANMFNASLLGGLVGGLAGGLIGAAIDKGEGSFMVNSILKVPLFPNEKDTVSFLLDGYTGEVSTLNKGKLKVQLLKTDIKLFKEFIKGDTSREGQKAVIKKMNKAY